MAYRRATARSTRPSPMPMRSSRSMRSPPPYPVDGTRRDAANPYQWRSTWPTIASSVAVAAASSPCRLSGREDDYDAPDRCERRWCWLRSPHRGCLRKKCRRHPDRHPPRQRRHVPRGRERHNPGGLPQPGPRPDDASHLRRSRHIRASPNAPRRRATGPGRGGRATVVSDSFTVLVIEPQ